MKRSNEALGTTEGTRIWISGDPLIYTRGCVPPFGLVRSVLRNNAIFKTPEIDLWQLRHLEIRAARPVFPEICHLGVRFRCGVPIEVDRVEPFIVSVSVALGDLGELEGVGVTLIRFTTPLAVPGPIHHKVVADVRV